MYIRVCYFPSLFFFIASFPEVLVFTLEIMIERKQALCFQFKMCLNQISCHAYEKLVFDVLHLTCKPIILRN